MSKLKVGKYFAKLHAMDWCVDKDNEDFHFNGVILCGADNNKSTAQAIAKFLNKRFLNKRRKKENLTNA